MFRELSVSVSMVEINGSMLLTYHSPSSAWTGGNDLTGCKTGYEYHYGNCLQLYYPGQIRLLPETHLFAVYPSNSAFAKDILKPLIALLIHTEHLPNMLLPAFTLECLMVCDAVEVWF